MNNHDRNEQQPLKAIAAIAHDINNKLTGVIGGIELTVSLLPDGDVAARNNLRLALESARAIQKLAAQLLITSRSQSKTTIPQTLDTNDNVEQLAPKAKTGERILLVDDDESTLDTIKQILQNLGYDINAVKSPGDALICLEKFSPFNLMITDIMMPYMDGSELMQRVRQLYPQMPTVLLSGLAASLDITKIKTFGGPVLSKPVSMSELAQVVRNTIDHSLAQSNST